MTGTCFGIGSVSGLRSVSVDRRSADLGDGASANPILISNAFDPPEPVPAGNFSSPCDAGSLPVPVFFSAGLRLFLWWSFFSVGETANGSLNVVCVVASLWVVFVV